MTEDEKWGDRLRIALDERLDGEVDDHPPPPSGDVVDACEQDLRRRHRRVLALVVALVVLALVPVGRLAWDERSRTSAPDPAGRTDPELVEQCLHGNQPASWAEGLTASGRPEVRLRGTVAGSTSLVLESADGRYWAECFVNHYADAEFTAGIEGIYYTDRTTSGLHYSTGYTCRDLDEPSPPPCPTFKLKYADRVPDEVAAVEFTTADGVVSRVVPDDGYLLLTYEGTVPDGDAPGADDRVDWLVQVTYRDAADQPIAAERFDPTERLTGDARVPGLPRLQAFRSFRKSPPWATYRPG